MITNTRNVIHLQITQATVLRVIIYVAQEKVEWYNQGDVHSKLLRTLYPIIVDHIVADEHGKSAQKRKRELENTRIVNHTDFRLVYRFMWCDFQHTILQRERKYMMLKIDDEDDEEMQLEEEEEEEEEKKTKNPFNLQTAIHLSVPTARFSG